jgi:DNA modification methylase
MLLNTDMVIENNYHLINGDCVENICFVEDESIHFSIFSPPFPELYVYSDDPRDFGNNHNLLSFGQQFSFLAPELFRIMKPGRLVAIHCMELPSFKAKDGFIGLKDFPGDIIRIMISFGFIFHTRVTIWKDPVVEMTRTKTIGLLNKQKDKDATLSRVGAPDYLIVFRKPGENTEPVRHSSTDQSDPNYIPIPLWQKYASPVWLDIKQTRTLNQEGRTNDDEKHICPLQLDTIERAIHLWTNPNDVVFTPFLGIGSEVYQALKMGRRGKGIELKKSYYDIAVKNCRNAVIQNSQLSLI